MLKKYFDDIFQTAQTGDAREESFYHDLTNLLETCADKNDHQDIHVTTLPKRTEAGNPDFRVWDGKQKITGYIEAKKPSVDDLRRIENSDLRFIQELLGHKNSQTTEIYTHVSKSSIGKIVSPLDSLDEC